MTLEEQFKCFVSGYYGIQNMDEYSLKEYILNDIKLYIEAFISQNPIPDFNYHEEVKKIEQTMSLRRKLQDSLLILHKIEAPMELILLVKARLKKTHL